jgi:uncharacterized membrane protein
VFSILGTLIILALIVGMIVWLVSGRGDRGGSVTATGESAREILDRRLASGEITVDQYQRLRETLGDGVSTTRDARPPNPASAHG